MKHRQSTVQKPLIKRALSAAAALSTAAMMLPELPLLGAAGIDVYDLYVCGTQVTTENANNILGDNSCSYSSSDKYLYINKSLSAEGKSAEVIYNAGIEGLTIYYTNDPDTGEAPVLTPENGRGTIALEADTTLSGYTGLTIEQSAASISLFDAALTIEGTENLTVGCIVGASGVKSDSEINLTLRNADVTFTDAVSVPGSIVLENTKLRQSDYIIQNGHILDGEGNFATDAEFYSYMVYDLWVGGVQVTTDNKDDILGNGYFSFNPNMTELTIKKNATTGSNTYYAYGTGMDAAIVSEEWLSIYVQDDFTILTDEPAGIQIYNNCEIKGPGKLTVNSRDTDAIQVLNSATLYLNDANVSAQSKYNALDGGGDMDPGYLYVWRSTLSAYSTGDDEAAICGFYGDIDLSCCRVKNDNVVQKDDGFYLDDESGDYAQTVNIIPTEYGLYVKSTCVTEDNCEDILGDGSTSYNPKTQTLTLTKDLTDEWCLISSELSGLTIEVVGDITLTVTNDDAVISGYGCTIIGDGSNTLTFDYLGVWAPAVMTYGGTLTIQDINVIGSVGTPGFIEEEFSSHHHEGPVTLNLINAGLTAFPYGSSEEDRRSGVYGFNQIIFNDCTVLEPLRGQIINGSIVDEDGNPAKVVIGTISLLGITSDPTDASGYVGDTVKFTVAAEGKDLSYQWQYYDTAWHDTTLTGATTPELSVAVKAARNGLKYRCIVTAKNGESVTSGAATLTVLPKITVQPKAVAAAVGDTAKFSVTVTGAGLTYQWQYYDGTWHNTSMTGAKTAELSVPVIAARNGLKYRCVVTDANGAVVKSNAVKLTVNTAITAQPKDASGYIGDTAKFTVAASGASLTYQWQYYDTAWHNTSMTGAKTAELSVPVIAGRNGLLYHCIITDANGKTVTSDDAKLTVLAKITTQPKAVSAAIGETAKFSVTASGAGLTYQWQYYDGTWHNTSMTGAKTATLSVPVIAGRNGLKYRCIITDANGAVVKSNAVALKVLTTITAQPKNASGYVGDTAKFTVTATGAGLTYQWQYYDTAWHDTSMTGAKTATLSVPVIAGRNGLKYRCIITDANGKTVTSGEAKLTVNAKITAQPKAVTATAGSTAKFTITATGAGLTYQWQYYNPKTDKWADTTLTGAKTATLSVGATTGRNGLSYRCIITDANGKTLTSSAALLTVK